jgi:hypothetical protein
MTVTAKLVVRLFAGDVQVVESEDPVLWQKVLAAVQRESSDLSPEVPPATAVRVGGGFVIRGAATGDDAVSRFAEEIGVSPESVMGACAPIAEAPYLHLNPRSFEQFKRNAPQRGPGAISSTALAATLMVLWREQVGLGPPSVPDCLAVLRPLGVTDGNGPRSVTNAPWLQLRNSVVYVNPAERTRALEVARGFCARPS